MASSRQFNSLTFYLIAALVYLVGAIVLFYLNGRDIGASETAHDIPPSLAIEITSFDSLNGWESDDLRPAADAFSNSCESLLTRNLNDRVNPLESHRFLDSFSLAGRVGDWKRVCNDIRSLSQTPQIRTFFERNFLPVKIHNRYAHGQTRSRDQSTTSFGKFTGYFEPQYKASRQPNAERSVPVLARPDDLIDVDLGTFRPELAGTRVAGRLNGKKLVPYHDHGDIIDGALEESASILAWVNPNDLLFLQIQGSGRLEFDDGTILRVGYAGQNGHPYTAVGKVLADNGTMPVSEISMQTIMAWLRQAEATEAKALREANKSYVFFQVLGELSNDEGPLGAQGIPLTAGRSLAVDRRYHAMGVPIWIETEAFPEPGPGAIRRLMVAQDTGGAIRGPVRGDFYWGTGESAGEMAGKMNVAGEMYVLLPKEIVARIPLQILQ